VSAPEKPKEPAGATPAPKPSPSTPAPGGAPAKPAAPAPAGGAKPAAPPAKPAGQPTPAPAAKPGYKVEPAKQPDLRGGDVGRRPQVVGMAAGNEIDAKKILESTKSALGGLFAKAQAKIAELKASPAEDAAPAAPADAPPAEGEDALPAAAAPAAAAPAAAPKLSPLYAAKAAAGNDHIVLRVGEGSGARAAKLIKQKGIKDVKVDGDRLEFHSVTNRTIQVFKALLEGHIELYGLERTTEAAPAGAPSPAAVDAPPAADAESAP
jgi:hypothetical protein